MSLDAKPNLAQKASEPSLRELLAHPFAKLFLSDTPLIDVRAPIEFQEGAFPNAVNLPLINDQERHDIGIEYKKNGQDAAIRLGHELVNDEVRATRTRAWLDFIAQHPGARLYCFRGGLRSQTSVEWIRAAGAEIELIPGGYKALRRFLLQVIAAAARELHLILLAGKTGSGKTLWIQNPAALQTELSTKLAVVDLGVIDLAVIDLEALAQHRGSAFGAMGVFGSQPSQINFENALAISILKSCHTHVPVTHLILEDESRSIGSVRIPDVLFEKMKIAPRVVVEASLSERVELIFRQYIQNSFRSPSENREFYLNALDRIRKKLGGLRADQIRKLMLAAFDEGASHHAWIEALLTEYYDPLYESKMSSIRSLAKIKTRFK